MKVIDYFLSLVLLLLIISCCKPTDLSYNRTCFFHYSFIKDGRVFDHFQGEPTRESSSSYSAIEGDSFTDVIFSPALYSHVVNNYVEYVQDEEITEFSFFYNNGLGWRWYINAPIVKDGEKYYFKYSESFLNSNRRYDAPTLFDEVAMYNPRFDNPDYDFVGWMSFTRRVNDPETVLRIEFEADYGSEEDLHNIHGRIDFREAMLRKIKGGDRLKSE